MRLKLIDKLKDDVRATGNLVVLSKKFSESDDEIGKLIRSILTTLLPRLHADDAARLTPEQMAALVLLLRGHDIPLVLATLTALEQVGDKSALLEVAELAENREEEDVEESVRKAAIACLSALQIRVEQREMKSTLLRASVVTGASPETLLRPAAGVATTQPEQLLRPANE